MTEDDEAALAAYRPILAAHDPEIRRAIDAIRAAVEDAPRSLDARTKALLALVIATCMRQSEPELRARIRRALAAGATPQEVLEALELIITPAGLPVFERALVAWADATGAPELHPEAAPFSPP